ncbi:MAG: SycD/LcrH family type III secretion system chaperone [Verrucomicrobiota bacterium]
MSETPEPIRPEASENLEGLLVDLMMQKTTLQIEKGISDEEMEVVYAHAHGLFQAGKYDEAEEVFKFLGLHDPIEPKYFLALGGCYEERKQFEQAAKYYMQSFLLNSEDPQGGVRAAICLRALGKIVEAEGALHLAIEQSSTDPKYDLVKTQAAALRDSMAESSAEATAP